MSPAEAGGGGAACDAAYLDTRRFTCHDLAMKIILDVLDSTGITATAGDTF